MRRIRKGDTEAWTLKHTHDTASTQTHAHAYPGFLLSGPDPVEVHAATGPAFLKVRFPSSLPPPKRKTMSNVTQCLTGKVCAPSRPNDRGHPGPGLPGPASPHLPAWPPSCARRLWPGRFPDTASIRPQLPGRAVAFEVAAEAAGRLFFSHLSPLIFPGSWPAARPFLTNGD